MHPASMHPASPYSLTHFDLTRYAAGHDQIFLRIRLEGTQLNTSIMSDQFLRTADGIALFNAPNVYDFQAIMD